MLVYLVVMTIAAITAVISLVSPRTYSRLIAFPAYGLVWLFMGLRDHVSGDFDMYVFFFKTYTSYGFFHARQLINTEIGYAILNWVVGHLTGNFHLVLLICAGTLLYGIWQVAREFDIDPALVLFVACPYLIFVVGMGYTRQSVGIGFSMLALCELRRDCTKRFYGYVLLATVFHYSAAAFLLAFWANTWRRSLVAVFFGLISFYSMLTSDVSSRLLGYASGVGSSGGVWFRILLLLSGYIVALTQLRHWRSMSRDYNLMFRSFIILLIMAIFARSQSVIVDRFSLYFFTFMLLGLARSVDFAQGLKGWVYFIAVGAFSYGITIFWFSTSEFARYSWLPYRFAFY